MRRILLLSAVAACVSVGVRAADTLPSDSVLTFNAFGTLGVAHSSEEQADFNRSAYLPIGAGATSSWSPAVDSLLAGQVRAQISPSLSGTVQVVSELRHDHTYKPHVEWAYLSFDATPELAIRLGRTSAPTFALTDTRRIGYAQHWVRPPSEVYDLVPVTNNDGIDIVWKTRAFGALHTFQGAYGRSESIATPRGQPPVTALSDHQLTLRYGYEKEAVTAYVNFGRDRLTIDGFEGLMSAIAMFGPQGQALVDRYNPRQRKGTFYGVGGTYDPGPWFVMGEWVRQENASLVGSRTGSYLSTGLRIGAFTPYVTWSDVTMNSERSTPGLDLAAVPPPLAPAAASLNYVLNDILQSNGDFTTIAGGVRWDFARSLALKGQYERIDIAPGSWGPLTNQQPGFVPGGSVRVLSLTLSFVR